MSEENDWCWADDAKNEVWPGNIWLKGWANTTPLRVTQTCQLKQMLKINVHERLFHKARHEPVVLTTWEAKFSWTCVCRLMMNLPWGRRRSRVFVILLCDLPEPGEIQALISLKNTNFFSLWIQFGILLWFHSSKRCHLFINFAFNCSECPSCQVWFL